MERNAGLTCLVCDRPVERGEDGAYRVPRIDDACICRDCLAGERDGYGANAERVRRQLATLAARKRGGGT